MGNRGQVLDNNHGIERINYGSSTDFLPWYWDEQRMGIYYYGRTDETGWHRVAYPSWIEAFNHIARSRRMLTSHHAGSNYAQEAENAGIILETQAQPLEDRVNERMQDLSYAMAHLLDKPGTQAQEDGGMAGFYSRMEQLGIDDTEDDEEGGMEGYYAKLMQAGIDDDTE